MIVTGLMLLLLLLDLRHPPNYLIDELETQNIKNKIYEQEDDEKIDFEGEEINSEDPKNNGNLSRQNLLAADEGMDFMQTRKINNRPSNSRGANRKTKNIFHQ